MKMFKKSTMLLIAMGMLLFACRPDNVAPSENDGGAPSLAGSSGDPHPKLDTVCQIADTIFLAREDDGSLLVNKCFGAPFPGGPVSQVPCNTTQIMPWGYLEMMEGYQDTNNYVDCNFTMAAGWYCDFNNWQFGISNSWSFDNNGIPIVGNDWGTSVVNPAQNKWQLRLMVAQVPEPCFQVALRINAVKLNLFGATIPGSATTLWGKNRRWNVPGDPRESVSPWLTPFCPLRCLETPPPPPTEESCVTFYNGISELGNCTNITASTAGLSGNLSYSWSTGATTATTSVCPTATTTYSVTVSSNGQPALINNVTVNVINIACGNGNGNNGLHKVTVCHLPPGNPTNQQNICIDWSGVPAHVARFRLPTYNIHMGHDSGCEIGSCGSNPCL